MEISHEGLVSLLQCELQYQSLNYRVWRLPGLAVSNSALYVVLKSLCLTWASFLYRSSHEPGQFVAPLSR